MPSFFCASFLWCKKKKIFCQTKKAWILTILKKKQMKKDVNKNIYLKFSSKMNTSMCKITGPPPDTSSGFFQTGLTEVHVWKFLVLINLSNMCDWILDMSNTKIFNFNFHRRIYFLISVSSTHNRNFFFMKVWCVLWMMSTHWCRQVDVRCLLQ